MGQDTFSNFGVAVSYKLDFKNLEMIKKIYHEDPESECYFHPGTKHVGCDDEVINLEDDEIAEIFEDALESKTEEELEEKLKDNNNRKVHFFNRVCETYARNISRRRCPTIWNKKKYSIDEVLEKIASFKNKYLNLGVPPEKIKIQGVLADSY